MKKGMWLASAVLMAIAFFFFMDRSADAVAIRPGGGMLSGKVWGYNMYDEPIPLIWARVSAYQGGILVESVSTGDNGSYIMFLPSGLLNVTAEHPGFKTQTKIIAISEGGSTQMNFYLERSEIPISEFEAYLLPIVAVALLVLTKAVTKRKRR